jgi:heptosyltransferase-3
MLNATSRILVINVARIGDTLLATPVLRALKAAAPRGTLTCLAHPDRAALLEQLPFLDRVGRITAKVAPLRGRFARHTYDAALVYGHDTPLVHYAARVADQVVAFRQKDPAAQARLTTSIDEPVSGVHAVESRARLAELLGVRVEDRRLAYHTSAAELQQARAWLTQAFGQLPSRLVGFQVASFPTKAYRDWPLASFTALARQLLATYPDCGLVILGGTETRDRAKALVAELGPRVVSAAGDFSLRGTAALMAQLALYVGVDTGPTHLAGALRIPMVAMYHCRHRGRFLAPLQHDRLAVLEHPAADANCTPETPMSDIPVDAVWQAVRALLG